MKKNSICILLVIVLAFSIAGCSKQNTNSTIPSSVVESKTDVEVLNETEKNPTSQVSNSENGASDSSNGKPESNTSSKETVSTVSKPATNKPDESKPTASKPATSHPSVSKPTDSKPVVSEPTTDKHTVPTTQMLEKIESYFLQYVNEERKSLGQPPLVVNETLQKASSKRVGELPQLFAHTRPNGELWDDVLEEYNYKTSKAAENINYFSQTKKFTGTEQELKDVAKLTFECFKNSNSHYQSIISPLYNETGVSFKWEEEENGNISFYCCHIFGAIKM